MNGQQTIATEDIKDRNKTQSTHHERPSLKTQTKSKAKANGKIMAKANNETTKAKEREEVKGIRFNQGYRNDTRKEYPKISFARNVP